MSEHEPRFIDEAECRELHRRMLARYGGSDGIRERSLLASAVATPRAGMFGQYFHETLPAMAAALAFALLRNHPFVDGNKRVGFLASVVFLRRNGYELVAEEKELIDLFLRLAAGEVTKDYLIPWYESHSQRFDESA